MGLYCDWRRLCYGILYDICRENWYAQALFLKGKKQMTQEWPVSEEQKSISWALRILQNAMEAKGDFYWLKIWTKQISIINCQNIVKCSISNQWLYPFDELKHPVDFDG